MDDYLRRVLIRIVAFVTAACVIGLLLALQARVLGGAIVATIYLVVLFSPFALLDALFAPLPKSGRSRLLRIGFAFLLLFANGAVLQWRALTSVSADLRAQIAVDMLIRNLALLGIYLAIEALLGSVIRRKVPA